MITNDRAISKNNGRIYTIQEKCLGKGSYGNVYLAKDEYQKKVAIKCCPVDTEGVPNILEASIMKTIQHPNINHAIDVVVSPHMLYIIQDLAVMDLHHYTSLYQLNHRCQLEELKIIYFSILQAVTILHDQNIIHCDIKASNILIYENGSIKLSDFTLATYDGQYTHTVCTCSHRPLECLLQQLWDKKLDIWSMGCTFYEIVCGELLFKNPEIDKDLSKKSAKKLLYQKSVNGILDWAKMTNQDISVDYYPVDYTPVKLSHRYQSVKTLLHDMLIIDPTLRPSCTDLLKHDFFTGLTPENPNYIQVKPIKLSHGEQARIVRYIQQGSSDPKVQSLAYHIYSKLDLPHLSEHYKAIGSTWIAHKMIEGSQPMVTQPLLISLDQILHVESEIVHDLHFRLIS